MDFGFIIFLIIASIVGNTIKESKKQQERNRSRSNTGYEKPKGNAQYSFKPPVRAGRDYGQKSGRMISHIPAGKAIRDTFEQVGKILVDDSFSLEGQREDIGKTYETAVLEAASFKERPLTAEPPQEDNVPSISYRRVSFEDNENRVYEENMQTGNHRSLDLNFTREDFIRGIVLAEVLGPPKCKKR